jgi:hypothetical protein
MDHHQGYIDNMCRICTQRAQTAAEVKKKKTSKFASTHKDMIYILFGVDVENDNPAIHPRKICNQCYQLLMNSRKSGSNGEMNLSGKYGQQKERVACFVSIWQEHIDNECNVCNIYQRQAVGGGRAKTAMGGKVKLQFDGTSNDVFFAKFGEGITLKKVENVK